MTTKVYGRARRSSGGPTDHHHKRQVYYTDVSRSEYRPQKGLVGPTVSITEGMTFPKHVAMRPQKAHLKLRRLPCGHGVFMLKGHFPDEETFCTQCRDGKAVR